MTTSVTGIIYEAGLLEPIERTLQLERGDFPLTDDARLVIHDESFGIWWGKEYPPGQGIHVEVDGKSRSGIRGNFIGAHTMTASVEGGGRLEARWTPVSPLTATTA